MKIPLGKENALMTGAEDTDGLWKADPSMNGQANRMKSKGGWIVLSFVFEGF